MMTIEELTSWRVAAIEGKLPPPARPDRWQPQRAGVVNMWEYDTAEVWYADGRMQLQGANESGKSTLMTLTTLLLLAGDTSGHNIDTLGASDKHFRYYVEPTDHALDRRDASTQKNRGWAWLEFGKGTDFFTLLLFAEARRADGALKVQWCTASGPVRVRSGLCLATAGFVADPAQFRDVPGFAVHPSGITYREAIARILYGMDEQWLNQLNRILRVVRTPQIGHKIDLKFLTDSFRTAAPDSRGRDQSARGRLGAVAAPAGRTRRGRAGTRASVRLQPASLAPVGGRGHPRRRRSGRRRDKRADADHQAREGRR